MIKGWPNRYLGASRIVIVHLKTDRTISGLLADRKKDMLILRPAMVASEDQNGAVVWNRIDGDVVIMMDNVDFYQEGVEASLAGLGKDLFEA